MRRIFTAEATMPELSYIIRLASWTDILKIVAGILQHFPKRICVGGALPAALGDRVTDRQYGEAARIRDRARDTVEHAALEFIEVI